METGKTRDDPLLPLIQALDTLWHDHLWFLLGNRNPPSNDHVRDRIAEREDGEHPPLLVALNAAIDASLVFYRIDPNSNPFNPDSAHHRVHGALITIYRFLVGWAAGDVTATPEELQRQWEVYAAARDLVGRIRYAVSNGINADPAGPPRELPEPPAGLDVTHWPNFTEAGERKRVSTSTVTRAVQAGKLKPAYRRGREKCVDPDALEKWKPDTTERQSEDERMDRIAKQRANANGAATIRPKANKVLVWTCAECDAGDFEGEHPDRCPECGHTEWKL